MTYTFLVFAWKFVCTVTSVYEVDVKYKIDLLLSYKSFHWNWRYQIHDRYPQNPFLRYTEISIQPLPQYDWLLFKSPFNKEVIILMNRIKFICQLAINHQSVDLSSQGWWGWWRRAPSAHWQGSRCQPGPECCHCRRPECSTSRPARWTTRGPPPGCSRPSGRGSAAGTRRVTGAR